MLHERSKRKVRVVRKKVRVSTGDVVVDDDGEREGRHLGLLADLYLRLQCVESSCQARPATAQLCCVRNFNLGCCKYRHLHTPATQWVALLYSTFSQHTSFSPLPAFSQSVLSVQPFSVGVSLGLKPSQQFPPVYPFQQDHFLPSDQYPHSQQDHHHQSYDHDHQSHDYDHHSQDYDHHYHGSIRPLHNYKPGLCPHQDEGFYQRPIFHGVYNDIPIGISSKSVGKQRCCCACHSDRV